MYSSSVFSGLGFEGLGVVPRAWAPSLALHDTGDQFSPGESYTPVFGGYPAPTLHSLHGCLWMETATGFRVLVGLSTQGHRRPRFPGGIPQESQAGTPEVHHNCHHNVSQHPKNECLLPLLPQISLSSPGEKGPVPVSPTLAPEYSQSGLHLLLPHCHLLGGAEGSPSPPRQNWAPHARGRRRLLILRVGVSRWKGFSLPELPDYYGRELSWCANTSWDR